MRPELHAQLRNVAPGDRQDVVAVALRRLYLRVTICHCLAAGLPPADPCTQCQHDLAAIEAGWDAPPTSRHSHDALIDDARAAWTLFQGMSTEALHGLQAAHTLDQAAATRPESLVFGAGRLALIAAVLRERGES